MSYHVDWDAEFLVSAEPEPSREREKPKKGRGSADERRRKPQEDNQMKLDVFEDDAT
jgi:hypothetical protein